MIDASCSRIGILHVEIVSALPERLPVCATSAQPEANG